MKLAFFPVISGTDDKLVMITDLKWMKNIEDFVCVPIYGIIQTILL